MSISTVKVTIKGVFQNDTPFTGFIRFALVHPGLASDTIIYPKEGQRLPFRSDGTMVVELIPNETIGSGSYYKYEIVRKTHSAVITKTDIMMDGTCVVPDHDCNFTDIIELETDPDEDLPTAKMYVQEAKTVEANVTNMYNEMVGKVYITSDSSKISNLVNDGIYIDVNSSLAGGTD